MSLKNMKMNPGDYIDVYTTGGHVFYWVEITETVTEETTVVIYGGTPLLIKNAQVVAVHTH